MCTQTESYSYLIHVSTALNVVNCYVWKLPTMVDPELCGNISMYQKPEYKKS